jgi:hypothetical protein
MESLRKTLNALTIRGRRMNLTSSDVLDLWNCTDKVEIVDEPAQINTASTTHNDDEINENSENESSGFKRGMGVAVYAKHFDEYVMQ